MTADVDTSRVIAAPMGRELLTRSTTSTLAAAIARAGFEPVQPSVPVFADRSWFDGNDFAVLEDIDRRAVHSGYLTRAARGTPECASDRLGEIVALPILSWFCDCHELFSSNRGVSPELS